MPGWHWEEAVGEEAGNKLPIVLEGQRTHIFQEKLKIPCNKPRCIFLALHKIFQKNVAALYKFMREL